jgi:hypothetical protein
MTECVHLARNADRPLDESVNDFFAHLIEAGVIKKQG